MLENKETARVPQEGHIHYNKEYYRGRYSNFIFWYNNLKYRIFWRSRLNNLRRVVNSGKILDVGCAFGFFIKFLEKEFDVYGIDISSYAIEQAARSVSLPGQLRCCDIKNGIPFTEKFDAITAFDIIEHIDDLGKVLSIFHKALNESGSLYLEFPCSRTLVDLDKGHYYRPLEEYIDNLKQAGFTSYLIRGYYTIGLRAIMIPAVNRINYCSMIVKRTPSKGG